MIPVEYRLSTLLRTAAPDTAGVSFDEVVRRVRRRRRVLAAGSATAVVTVVAGLTVGVAGLRGDRPERLATGPTPASSVAPRAVTFEGITFELPDGWTVAQPSCGPPADHTVVIGTWTGSCPGGSAGAAPTTGVTLTALYGRQFALGWLGRRTTWHEQPAWLAQQTSGGVAMVTLSLPWANGFVTAQSGDAAAARDLLDRVSVRVADGPTVPADATSVFVQSLAGHDGDGQQRNATVTDAADLQRLLADLRALTPVTSPAQACDGSWPRTALLTVHSDGQERTYAARFDACGLVVAGTGSAARTSGQLLSDVRRLVRNSGL